MVTVDTLGGCILWHCGLLACDWTQLTLTPTATFFSRHAACPARGVNMSWKACGRTAMSHSLVGSRYHRTLPQNPSSGALSTPPPKKKIGKGRGPRRCRDMDLVHGSNRQGTGILATTSLHARGLGGFPGSVGPIFGGRSAHPQISQTPGTPNPPSYHG